MRIIPIAALSAGLLLAACDSKVEVTSTLDDPLADRIAIEDMITRYYASLGAGEPGAFGDYYTEDAVFDVNGVVSTGHEEIEALYAGMGDGDGVEGDPGVFHMLLTNPVIDVDGDTASASFIWTGVLNTDIKAPPQFAEQGREYDLLVKQEDGSWLIKKRTVIADSGMPDQFDKTYQPRMDYDITAN